MATKDTTSFSTAIPFFNAGQERAAALQKELLDSYLQASQAWFARVQSEVNLWSDLAAKLTATRSIPEALEAYTKCVSQQVQMTAEDGQRLINDYQQIAKKIGNSFSGDGPMAST
jgi:hypothetical protein